MSDGNSILQRWQAYSPSKGTWFWSCVGAIVLTMIIGFTAGGWVTGGTARSMAAQASQDAQEQLVASICVNRFVAAPGAQGNLAKLKDARSWDRDNLIEDGGWVNVEALDEPVKGAADACAKKLVAMESIPASSTAPKAALDAATPVGG